MRQKGRKCSCLATQAFARLDPLDLTTLLATVHPRCMRLALYLNGSNCSVAAAKIPAHDRGSEAMAYCG